MLFAVLPMPYIIALMKKYRSKQIVTLIVLVLLFFASRFDWERENISSVKPTAWHRDTYDFIDGELLYNRSHLIAFMFTGQGANPLNLITGTRYMNATGMLPYEEEVADYLRYSDDYVLYRVTPYFEGDDLLASGVLMEAKSVSDDGDSLQFCIYCYNVQPGIGIDYSDGDNWLLDDEDLDSREF